MVVTEKRNKTLTFQKMISDPELSTIISSYACNNSHYDIKNNSPTEKRLEENQILTQNNDTASRNKECKNCTN